MKTALTLACVSVNFAAAQWGAITPPPENSCGNHWTQPGPPSLFQLITESYEQAMAQAYGAKRCITEKEYEQMDKCDMLIREELKNRNEHAISIKQKEEVESNLW